MTTSDLLPLLAVSGLTRKFANVTAVWAVDLTVREGDCIAIFGPNGAGKTTLLRLIAQLIKPSAGEIKFRDESETRAGHIGYVSHQSLLYGDLTGFENLLFFARLYGLENPRGRSLAMLEKLKLADASDRYARGYSSGMKQRLALARALLHDPDLLLFDEPYAGLDQHGSRLLSSLLGQLRDEGRTILMITHNLAEGLSISTRAVIMNRGRVVHDGVCEESDRSQFENLYFDLTRG